MKRTKLFPKLSDRELLELEIKVLEQAAYCKGFRQQAVALRRLIVAAKLQRGI